MFAFPMTMMGAAVSSYDPDAQAYIDRLTGTYSTAELDAINDFVVSLKNRTLAAGGNQFDGLIFVLMSLTNATDSVLDIGGSFDATINGATHSPDIGFSTDGINDYIDTGLSTTSGGTNTTIGWHINTAWAGYAGGCDQPGSFGTHLSPGFFRLNRGTSGGETFSTTASSGSFTASRDGSSVSLSENQTDLGSYTASFSNNTSLNLWFGAFNNGSGGTAFLNTTFRAYWIHPGKPWTHAEKIAFHSDLDNLLNSL